MVSEMRTHPLYTVIPLLEVLGVNTLRLRQNGCRFADDIFKCVLLNENVWTSIKISLKFVPKGLINNIPALVQIMAWHWPGGKALSEAMMVKLHTHIYIYMHHSANCDFVWWVIKCTVMGRFYYGQWEKIWHCFMGALLPGRAFLIRLLGKALLLIEIIWYLFVNICIGHQKICLPGLTISAHTNWKPIPLMSFIARQCCWDYFL